MALVKCKECNSEISNTANKCPNCGAQQNVITQLVSGLIAIALMIYFSSDLAQVIVYLMQKGQ